MATEKLQIVLDADWRGGAAVRRADQEIGGMTERATRNWGNVVKGIGAATLAIGAVGVAAGQAYQLIGEGADLLRAEDQFGRLAESIDSTADSLMGRLRDATRGMVTDAELVQSATQIMSLGLQDTEDGVTRLTSVAGQLGWDMNQVILTMANNSTMRLDALGLSIEDVQTKMRALEEQGFDADKAFDLAVIEAGEEKIRLLGDTADTTAGQMKILEAAVGNATNEFKVELARGFAGGLAEISGSAAQAATDLQVLTGAVGGFFGKLAGGAIGVAAAQISADVVTDNAVALGLMSEQYARSLMQRQKRGDPGAADEVALYARRVDEFKQSADALHDSWGAVSDSAAAMVDSTEAMVSSMMLVEPPTKTAYDAIMRYGENVFWAGGNTEKMAELVKSLPEAFGGVVSSAGPAADGIGEIGAEALAAEERTRKLMEELDKLNGMTVEAHITLREQVLKYYDAGGDGSNDQPEPRAIGGPVYANEPYLVGERGPELFVPNGSGTIVPNGQLPAGSGDTFIFNNREAAAHGLTMLSALRRGPLNRRMGLAR